MSIRKEIENFATSMEVKMSLHDGTRGNSWKNEDLSFFIMRMEEELQEVKEEFRYYEKVSTDDCRAQISLGKMKAEAADVANFAMMLHYQSGIRSDMHGEKLRRENLKVQQTTFYIDGKKYTLKIEEV